MGCEVARTLMQQYLVETDNILEGTRDRAALRHKVRKATYPMHKGRIPFTDSKVTNGRKAIRRMFDLKPFSEIAYK